VAADAYERFCRQRSPKWDTVSLPVAAFRTLANPIQSLHGVPTG